MLVTRVFSRASPTRIFRRLPSSRFPQPFPSVLSSCTAQWKRLKHDNANDNGPKFPHQTKIPTSSQDKSAFTRGDHSDSSPTSQRANKLAQETSQQQDLFEENPELDSEARPQRNTVSESQPGPGVNRVIDGTARTGGAAERSDFDTAQPEFSSSESPRDNADFQEKPVEQKPLPDLRQGIPSTFAEEFLNHKTTSQTDETSGTSEDALKKAGQSSSRGVSGEGALPKSAYKTSIDKRRERWAAWLYIIFGSLAVGGTLSLGRNWDTEEEERAHMTDAPSGWGLWLFYNRVKARVAGQMGYYTEPTFPKLLPLVDPPPPYTLVLSLEDLMIHSEWTREHGWRTAKRPGVDYFLGYLSQYYELVLFTSLPVGAADQIVRKLDPYHFMTFPLFREATRYEKGEYIKDLSYLNRPLSKTILIDTKPEHAKAQPENAIILKPWKGETGDKELVALIPFLEQIAAMGIPDVRAALKSYEGKHIPTEFALREAKARELFNRQFAEEQAKKPKRSLGTLLNNAVGIKPQQGGMTFDGQQSVAEGLAAGKMLGDQIRESGIKRYRELEKEIRENGDKWLKEEAELEKNAQAEQVKSMKGGALSFLGIGGKDGKE